MRRLDDDLKHNVAYWAAHYVRRTPVTAHLILNVYSHAVLCRDSGAPPTNGFEGHLPSRSVHREVYVALQAVADHELRLMRACFHLECTIYL